MCVCVCVCYLPAQLTACHFTDIVAVWILIKKLERPKFVSVLEYCSYIMAVVYNTKKFFFFIVRFQAFAMKWMRTVFFWAITQCVMVIALDVSGQHISPPLKMGPICCPETSVRNYNYRLHNSPEGHSSGFFFFALKFDTAKKW